MYKVLQAPENLHILNLHAWVHNANNATLKQQNEVCKNDLKK